MKLVRRLTLYQLLVIGCVFAIDTWLGVRSDLSAFETDVRRDERILGEAFGHALETAWRDGGFAAAQALVREANRRESDVRLRIVLLDDDADRAGTPEAPRRAAEALRETRTVTHVRDEGGDAARIFTYVPLASPSGRPAALELSEDMTHERAYTATRVRRTLVTAALAALGCGLVAWAVGVRVVGRPIAALVDKSRRIGAGDFSSPLVLTQRDELSLLAREMNDTAAALDAALGRIEQESLARIAALEQLRHADRLTTVGKLASGIAHELGTPLNVVAGRAKMIFAGEAANREESAECARIIHEQAERMTRIVRQLLDFARRRSPEKTSADLLRLAKQTLALLEPLAAKRGVRLRLEAGAEPVRGSVDTSQIQQALTNLVMNAIQASGRDQEVTLRVEPAKPPVGVEAARSWTAALRLEVEDRGEGIPADRLSAVFDPFFTTKPVGEGTGLGLSVAHGIAQEHGGWIEVESAPGRGSRFTLWLPGDSA